MNSYKVLQNNYGLYGQELNDGMPNEHDVEFLDKQHIIDYIVNSFPYNILPYIKELGIDYFLDKISGEELDYMLQSLENTPLNFTLLKEYTYPEFNLTKKSFLHCYISLTELVSSVEFNVEYDQERKLSAIKYFFLSKGIQLSEKDLNTILNYVLEWSYNDGQ